MLKQGKCVLAENLQFVPTKRQQERGACRGRDQRGSHSAHQTFGKSKTLRRNPCTDFANSAQHETHNVTACMKTNGRREAEKEQTAKALLQ